MRIKQEGVWIADPGPVTFTAEDIAFLEREAPYTAKRRARICAHEEGERVHQMLIAFCADSVNPWHAHEEMESVQVIRGALTVSMVVGEATLVRRLRAGDFLRIPGGIFHQPLPEGPCVVLETAQK